MHKGLLGHTSHEELLAYGLSWLFGGRGRATKWDPLVPDIVDHELVGIVLDEWVQALHMDLEV